MLNETNATVAESDIYISQLWHFDNLHFWHRAVQSAQNMHKRLHIHKATTAIVKQYLT